MQIFITGLGTYLLLIVGQFTSGINVTTSKVSSSNVTDFFTADSITAASGAIADAAIGTAEIADLAVSTAKIADLNVSGAKIANAAITNAKVSDLHAGKIQASSLDVASKGVVGSAGNILQLEQVVVVLLHSLQVVTRLRLLYSTELAIVF